MFSRSGPLLLVYGRNSYKKSDSLSQFGIYRSLISTSVQAVSCLIRHVLFQFQLHFCIQSFYLGPDLHLSGWGHHILGTAPVWGGLTAHRGHQLHLAHPDGAGHSDHDHQDLAPHVPRPAPVCLVQVPKPNSKNTYFPILLLDVFQGAESEAGWRE